MLEQGKKKWSDGEEARFVAAIDAIVKKGLWSEIKGDDELGKRGANGIRSHWEALVSLPSGAVSRTSLMPGVVQEVAEGPVVVAVRWFRRQG